MDDDASGLISYDELADMVRNELMIRTSALPERELKAVWLSLDEDHSGHISVGEFGNFVRLGDHVHDEERREREASDTCCFVVCVPAQWVMSLLLALGSR